MSRDTSTTKGRMGHPFKKIEGSVSYAEAVAKWLLEVQNGMHADCILLEEPTNPKTGDVFIVRRSLRRKSRVKNSIWKRLATTSITRDKIKIDVNIFTISNEAGVAIYTKRIFRIRNTPENPIDPSLYILAFDNTENGESENIPEDLYASTTLFGPNGRVGIKLKRQQHLEQVRLQHTEEANSSRQNPRQRSFKTARKSTSSLRRQRVGIEAEEVGKDEMFRKPQEKFQDLGDDNNWNLETSPMDGYFDQKQYSAMKQSKKGMLTKRRQGEYIENYEEFDVFHARDGVNTGRMLRNKKFPRLDIGEVDLATESSQSPFDTNPMLNPFNDDEVQAGAELKNSNTCILQGINRKLASAQRLTEEIIEENGPIPTVTVKLSASGLKITAVKFI